MSCRSAIPAMAIFLLAACAAREPAPAPNDEAGLRAADSMYTAGMRTLDVPALVGLYAPDAVLYAPGEAPHTGLAAIREFATAFASATGLTMTAEVHSLSASGDLGYTVNMINASYTDPNGKPVSERMRDVHVWRKDANGQWKIVIDVWNSPPADSGSAR